MGFDTRENRRRFVKIYTILLVIIPLVLLCLSLIKPDMLLWMRVLISIMVWNIAGGVRFIMGDDIAERLIGRFIAIAMLFVFPFFYLYQVFYLLTHREETL